MLLLRLLLVELLLRLLELELLLRLELLLELLELLDELLPPPPRRSCARALEMLSPPTTRTPAANSNATCLSKILIFIRASCAALRRTKGSMLKREECIDGKVYARLNR